MRTFETLHFTHDCHPVNHTVYGTGNARTATDAREIAAEEAYETLRKAYNIDCELLIPPTSMLISLLNYSPTVRHAINNLAQHIFKNQTSVTYSETQEEPKHSGLWIAECKSVFWNLLNRLFF